MAKITKVYGYPKMGVHTDKQKQIEWAKDSDMVWTIQEFLDEVSKDELLLKAFVFKTFEEDNSTHDVTINDLELAKYLAGEKAMDELYRNDEGNYEIDADWDDDNPPKEFVNLKEDYVEHYLKIIENTKIK
jgi:hypothetical protein